MNFSPVVHSFKKIIFTKYVITSIVIVSIVCNIIFFTLCLITDFFHKTQTPFLSPKVIVKNQQDLLINFVDLRTKVFSYVDNIPPTDKLSVYFEYLPTGASIGVKEKDPYTFASLLKVPIIMAVYKKIENHELRFENIITIEKNDIDKTFGDLWKKGPGTEITVRDAINEILSNSDNTAKNALGKYIPKSDVDDVFAHLDIPEETDKNSPVVTPKNYSSVLRSLYFATYLSESSSNDILKTLTLSHFDDKIAQPIPNNIAVAHKIGVYDNETDTTQIPVFSDCGIIYLPRRPYILCIMAQAPENHARKYMQDISRMIYSFLKH